MQKSKNLNDYAEFVARVRENRATGMTFDEAVKEAVIYCTGKGILREFLETHGTEVMNMLFTEFNMDDALAISREEGIEEGIERGVEMGLENKTRELLELIQQGFTLEEIENKLKETIRH